MTQKIVRIAGKGSQTSCHEVWKPLCPFSGPIKPPLWGTRLTFLEFENNFEESFKCRIFVPPLPLHPLPSAYQHAVPSKTGPTTGFDLQTFDVRVQCKYCHFYVFFLKLNIQGTSPTVSKMDLSLRSIEVRLLTKFSMGRKFLLWPLCRYDVKPKREKRIKVILSLTRHALSKLYNTGHLTILPSIRKTPKRSKFMLRS